MSEHEDMIPPETYQPPAVQPQQPPVTGFRSSPEVDKLWGALAPALGKMEAPKRTKTATVRGTARSGREFDYTFSFAPLEEIVRVARPVLAEAKAGFWQFPVYRGEQSMLRTVLYHESGQWLSLDYPIFWEVPRGGQGFASGVTYARRYGLTLALGLAAEDDDDANLAQGNEATIGPSQTEDFVRTQQRQPNVRQFPQGVVSKANPAVGPARTKAAEANERLERAIDATTDWIGLRAIWDTRNYSWGQQYRADAEEVEAASPAALHALKQRASRQLTTFSEVKRGQPAKPPLKGDPPMTTAKAGFVEPLVPSTEAIEKVRELANESNRQHHLANLVQIARDAALLGGKDGLRAYARKLAETDEAEKTTDWSDIRDEVMSMVVPIAERYDEGALTPEERAEAAKLADQAKPVQVAPPADDLGLPPPQPPRGGKGRRTAA